VARIFLFSIIPSLYAAISVRSWSKRSRDDKHGWGIDGPGSRAWGDFSGEVNKPSYASQSSKLLLSLFWAPKSRDNELDLIVPHAGPKRGRLSQWITREFLPFWQSIQKVRGRQTTPIDLDLGT
jgi:hypothetical protein